VGLVNTVKYFVIKKNTWNTLIGQGAESLPEVNVFIAVG
jgi:hypothetical protein